MEEGMKQFEDGEGDANSKGEDGRSEEGGEEENLRSAISVAYGILDTMEQQKTIMNGHSRIIGIICFQTSPLSRRENLEVLVDAFFVDSPI